MIKFIVLFTFSTLILSGQSYDNLIETGIDYLPINTDSALLIFEKAKALNPDRYEAWYHLAYCYSSVGKFNETIHFSKEALERKGDDARSYALLGVAEILSVDKVKGCMDLQKSINLDGEIEGVNEMFGILCGRYYRVNIESQLADSLIIDRIQTKIGSNWLLTGIKETSEYLKLRVNNTNFINHLENRTFDIEIGIYIFNKKHKNNLSVVNEDYKVITSKVGYGSYTLNEIEILIASIDSYIKPQVKKEYLRQRKKLINDISELMKSP